VIENIENIQPGRYRMRNGTVAIVSHSDSTLPAPYHWVGSVGDTTDVWDINGCYYGNDHESPWDLVWRLPDESQPQPQPPADDRIERALQAQLAASQAVIIEERLMRLEALQVLKSIPSGGEWVLLEAEELDKLRKILEGKKE
jgi:hypothetical protein